ncbi:extracellular solute-binding protein [Rubricella aquisinus]|nr:extracellular solute-binding protein [Rubricella aquisinus]
MFTLRLPALCVTLALPAAVWAQEDVIIAHGISTFGELKYDADFELLDYVNPDAPKGGEFSTWAIGSFDTLHLYTTAGTGAASAAILFEPLMVATADEPDALYGLIAETIEYPADRSWAVFNMRPEATFSDGTPITADDVVFTFNILSEKGIPALRSVFADFETVEAIGTHRVRFDFRDGANTRELPMTAAGLPVFSEDWWADKDFSRSTLEPGPGSAPYILESVDPGRQIIYTRNPDYWGWHLPINRGRHNFDTLRFEHYADGTAAFEGFKAGAYDFRVENTSAIWALEYDFPAVQEGRIVKRDYPDGNVSNAQNFLFNLREEKFADPRVREAISMMFNFEWTNRTQFYGLYERSKSFWPGSPLEAVGPPSDAELALLEPLADLLPEGVLTDPALEPIVNSPDRISRSVFREAGRLLDEAGWTVQDGLRRNADGETLDVSFLLFSTAFERISNPIVENLKTLGVNAQLERVEVSQFVERRRSFDFDMLTSSFVNDLSPGLSLRQWFGSENAMVPSRNLAGLQSEAVDALIEEVINAATREEMQVAARALDRVLRAERIGIPQWYKNSNWVAYVDVFDHPDPLPPYLLGETDFWWYSEEKEQALRDRGVY